MLGAAIDNARLVKRSRRHLAQVQALWEIDKAIVEDRDLTEVFGTIARAASRLSGGEAVIVLLDGKEDLQVPGGDRSRALELLGDPPVPGRHAAGRATSPAPPPRACASDRTTSGARSWSRSAGRPDARRPGRRADVHRLGGGGPHHAGHARPPRGRGPDQGRRPAGGGPPRRPARPPGRGLRDRGQHARRGRPPRRHRALRPALVRPLQRVDLPRAAGRARGSPGGRGGGRGHR